MPMTDKEYLKSHGLKCPFCRSNKIESGPVEIALSCFGSANVTCLECGKEWKDLYSLVGYSEK